MCVFKVCGKQFLAARAPISKKQEVASSAAKHLIILPEIGGSFYMNLSGCLAEGGLHLYILKSRESYKPSFKSLLFQKIGWEIQCIACSHLKLRRSCLTFTSSVLLSMWVFLVFWLIFLVCLWVYHRTLFGGVWLLPLTVQSVWMSHASLLQSGMQLFEKLIVSYFMVVSNRSLPRFCRTDRLTNRYGI